MNETAPNPTADLPSSHPLIKVSKGLAMVLTLALIVLTPAVTRMYYDALTDTMLAEENREIVAGNIEAVTDHPRGRRVDYAFTVGDVPFTGYAVLTESQAAHYVSGSTIEVAYSPNMPSVHRPVVLLDDGAPPGDPEEVRKTGISIILVIGLLLWTLSSWEHVYLALRYAVATGAISGNQIAKIIFNGLFILLLVLLLKLVFTLALSHAAGVRNEAWLRQALTALGVLAALVFLAKSTPFYTQKTYP